MAHERPLGRSATQTATLDARTAEIAAWVGLLARTLKTCRLYDRDNPRVVEFRGTLAAQLLAHLEHHGPFELEFLPHEVRCDEQPVLGQNHRDAQLTLPFHRDGLRTLAFQPGIEAVELDTLLDVILAATQRSGDDAEDLVTLLWDANLPHVDMGYVAAETDADVGDDSDEHSDRGASGPLALIPWPGGAPGDYEPAADPDAPAKGPGPETGSTHEGADHSVVRLRSEDWLAGEPWEDLERCYREVETAHDAGLERFNEIVHRDRERPLSRATLELVRDALASGLRPGDEEELVELLARALPDAIADGDWAIAHEFVDTLLEASAGRWDPAAVIEALAKPDAPATVALVRRLDGGALASLQDFIAFARGLGPATIEWLMSIVASAQQQRTRRLLVRALGELCEGNPERLAPWLADPRWYVVRNAVLVLGAGESTVPAGLLRPLLRHPEPRVRSEVVQALAHAEPEAARPLLIALLHDAEPPIVKSALRLLGERRNPRVCAALLERVDTPDFHRLPLEQVRPLLAALGGCGDDSALPHLEAQLHAPGWFDLSAAPFRRAVTRCIARIGTPAAGALLEQGTHSRTPAVRDACRFALAGGGRD